MLWTCSGLNVDSLKRANNLEQSERSGCDVDGIEGATWTDLW